MPHSTNLLENIIAPATCGVCLQGHAQSSRGDKHMGALRLLPKHHHVPTDSCAHSQLDEGAFNHPCTIIAVSACGHLVFCLQITSFGGRTIRQKYSGLSLDYPVFDEYLAFKETNTFPHNNHGELSYTGPAMDHQSYAHLEYGFWIEWSNLKPCEGRQLAPQSLEKARQLYAKAERHRQSHGSRGDRKLASITRTPSPPSFQSPTPKTTAASSTLSWRSGPPVQAQVPVPTSTGPPLFVVPQRQKRPLPITPPPSPEKRLAMAGNWRRPVAT